MADRLVRKAGLTWSAVVAGFASSGGRQKPDQRAQQEQRQREEQTQQAREEQAQATRERQRRQEREEQERREREREAQEQREREAQWEHEREEQARRAGEEQTQREREEQEQREREEQAEANPWCQTDDEVQSEREQRWAGFETGRPDASEAAGPDPTRDASTGEGAWTTREGRYPSSAALNAGPGEMGLRRLAAWPLAVMCLALRWAARLVALAWIVALLASGAGGRGFWAVLFLILLPSWIIWAVLRSISNALGRGAHRFAGEWTTVRPDGAGRHVEELRRWKGWRPPSV